MDLAGAGGSAQFCQIIPNDGPQRIDGLQGLPVVEMPEGPAIACIKALHLRAESMNGAGLAVCC